MKYLITMLLYGSVTTLLCAQIKIPAMSPPAKLSQTIGLTDITIEYSRPNLRGRTALGKEGVIPYGEKWRTGANSASSLTTSTDIMIDDHIIPKGKYAILTTPYTAYWELHLYPFETGNWSSYVKKTPLVTVRSSMVTTDIGLQSLLISFDNITLESGDLILWWGQHLMTFHIEASSHEQILANIKRELDGPSSFDYFQAALYLHETQTDLTQALSYIREVTKSEKARFFEVHREALILADLGQKQDAIASAKRSKQLSQTANNQDFVRLNERLIARLK